MVLFLSQENPRKRNVTTTIACSLEPGLSFQQLRATVSCLFEVQDYVVNFCGERKSHTLSALGLLILYKFSLPSLAAAVSSFVYLHSNNIMKTQSDLQTRPPRAIARLNPPNCWLLLLSWSPFSLYFEDMTYFPLRTFDFYAGTKHFVSHLSHSQPPSPLEKKAKRRKAQKCNGALGSHAFATALYVKALKGNSTLIVKPLTCLPRCCQEVLCIARTKAIFSYGLTKHQRAARSTEHQNRGGK